MSSKDNRVMVRTGSVLRSEVMANGYMLVADEPIGMDGTNSGPTSYDYLLAALGACTAPSLEQTAEGGFAEYFEPFTGEPLRSREQSWTAAVVLDWLASGPQREMRAA